MSRMDSSSQHVHEIDEAVITGPTQGSRKLKFKHLRGLASDCPTGVAPVLEDVSLDTIASSSETASGRRAAFGGGLLL